MRIDQTIVLYGSGSAEEKLAILSADSLCISKLLYMLQLQPIIPICDCAGWVVLSTKMEELALRFSWHVTQVIDTQNDENNAITILRTEF